MADIRIKDLTSPASSTASDDFIAVDGTTNGTRKLNAFSPTFGGNATVTGTLTVNGTGTSEFGGLVRITAGGFRSYGSMTLGATYAGMGGGFQTSYDTPTTRIFYGDGTGFDLRFATRASSTTTDRFTFSDTGKLTISGTDASTTTSSGALVVGNGTSGGLGVGGAIFAGQSVSVVQSLADNNGFRVINTNTAGLPGLYLEGDGSEYALIRRNNSTAGNPRRVEYIATGSGANHYFNTNTIIAGTITTNAPSGGTAAAWKLGTVATVSPTSPNRTIEVDIGGTIYYIHAKTTNN